MALIHHTELGRLVVSSLGGCMEKCTQGTQSDRGVKPQHICPYISAPTFYIQQVHSTNLQSSHLSMRHLLLCCRWVCFVDPSVTAVSDGRLVDQCRGGEGCLAELTPPEGGDGELTRKIQSCRSRRVLSTVRGQLGLYVHSADGAFSAGGQPLIHTRLVEEVHAG